MNCPTEQALDVIELAFRAGSHLGENREFTTSSQPTVRPEDAVAELNGRFREHGIGFQFESAEIIRVDSQFLHSEAVKPALTLLADAAFSGANSEFLRAHEHYRNGRNAECMNECLKALESTLKVICSKRKWQFKETDTAKALIEVAFSNGLIPPWLQSEFTALRSTLESGVPTARNRLSGHGQGTEAREVPQHFASYQLHLTASAILFLVESFRTSA